MSAAVLGVMINEAMIPGRRGATMMSGGTNDATNAGKRGGVSDTTSDEMIDGAMSNLGSAATTAETSDAMNDLRNVATTAETCDAMSDPKTGATAGTGAVLRVNSARNAITTALNVRSDAAALRLRTNGDIAVKNGRMNVEAAAMMREMLRDGSTAAPLLVLVIDLMRRGRTNEMKLGIDDTPALKIAATIRGVASE